MQKIKGFFKRQKENGDKIKRKFAVKRGLYSVVLTAAVLAIIIIINLTVSAIAKKANLEYDMTADKSLTISEDNLEYLKSIKEPVNIYVIGKESEYSAFLNSYSEQYFNTSPDDNMFKLTVNLINKYNDISDNISVEYVDVQSSRYAEISSLFPNEKITPTDIFITSKDTENTKYKHLTFNDIYSRSDETGYAAYGYSLYTINGNRLETALTSAINYVVTKEVKNVLIYKGHSTTDYSAPYVELLNKNNYTVETSNEKLLSNIDKKYDVIIILAPTTDFLPNEVDLLKSFITDGKSVLYFASAETPVLPTLYGMLAEYGISTEEGILTETNTNALPNKDVPTAVLSFPDENNVLGEGTNAFVTGYNVPMLKADTSIEHATVTAIATTLKTVKASENGETKNYNTIIETAVENDDKTGYLYAFSSVEFITSDWAENAQLSNKDIVLSITDKSANKSDTAVSFVDKSLLSDGYTDQVTTAKTVRLRRVLYLISFAVLIAGIVVFIRRRNAK
ncbi:MAG: GldG family protein [Clostridia bacterium]|nr:GldG family protein [Clostridia bacterium]